MKPKYTKQNEIDILYRLILCLDRYEEYSNIDKLNILCMEFYTDPSQNTDWLDQNKHRYPRETTPEVYEFYVSDTELKNIREDNFNTIFKLTEKNQTWKNKVKITICEDE